MIKTNLFWIPSKLPQNYKELKKFGASKLPILPLTIEREIKIPKRIETNWFV